MSKNCTQKLVSAFFPMIGRIAAENIGPCEECNSTNWDIMDGDIRPNLSTVKDILYSSHVLVLTCRDCGCSTKLEIDLGDKERRELAEVFVSAYIQEEPGAMVFREDLINSVLKK